MIPEISLIQAFRILSLVLNPSYFPLSICLRLVLTVELACFPSCPWFPSETN